MLIARAPLRAHRVDLVDEHGARRVEVRHLEQQAHELLGLAVVLGGEARRADVEEGGLALGGDGLGEHGLAGAGRTDHEDAAVGAADAAEELGHDHGQDDRLLEQLFGVLAASDVVPFDVRIPLHDVSFERFDQVLVVAGRFEAFFWRYKGGGFEAILKGVYESGTVFGDY